MTTNPLARFYRWVRGSRLGLAALVYVALFALFIAALLLTQSQLLSILGTVVFTVGATLLAALKFATDLRSSTNAQIAVLRELSSVEVAAADQRTRESIETLRRSNDEQAKVLSQRLDSVVGLLGATAEASKASLDRAKELADAQARARAEAEAKFQQEQEAIREADLGRYPRVKLRIVERPVGLFGIVDYWLYVGNETPVKTIRVTARAKNTVRNVYGPPHQRAMKDLTLTNEIPLLNIGGFGVRGVYDAVEVVVEVVNPEGERFARAALFTLSQGDWWELPMERTA